jgi:DNA-binding NtrC family response regulator
MNKILRILHLEDVRSDAEIVKRAMDKSEIAFEWHLATNKTDFQKALTDFHPDIIISDHTLPSFTSVQALKMVREAGMTIPFILVTSTISEEFAVEMMKEGIDDYLLKDRLQRLPNAVLGALEKRKREREKEEHHAEIARREANLHAIIETSDVTIYSLDLNFKYITFNTLHKNNLKEAYGLDISWRQCVRLP